MRFKRKWIYLTLAFAAAVPGVVRVIGIRNGPGTASAAVTNDPPTLRLVASLSEKRLRMYEADTLVWEYPVAVGSPSYPTPAGNYSIRRLVWNPSWTPPPGSAWAKKYTPKEPGHPANPMKVVKIFFKEPDYYIHGTGEVNSLGSAASHGCLRMDPEHVAEVARWVMEHGGQPREENWFWRIVHFRNEEKPIYLTNPIPLTVAR